MGDEDDEADASMIRKVAEPLLKKLAFWVVTAAVAAVSGGAVHTVEDANHEATVQESHTQGLNTEAELKALKEGLGQLVAALQEEQNKREEHVRRLEDRVAWMQGRLNLPAPPRTSSAEPFIGSYPEQGP